MHSKTVWAICWMSDRTILQGLLTKVLRTVTEAFEEVSAAFECCAYRYPEQICTSDGHALNSTLLTTAHGNSRNIAADTKRLEGQ